MVNNADPDQMTLSADLDLQFSKEEIFWFSKMRVKTHSG